ncbi:MAG: superoxide dismutase [Gammaproteobacteria bacterium]|nr:superoxide dismutase [Gammaproteobacteria bacterium]
MKRAHVTPLIVASLLIWGCTDSDSNQAGNNSKKFTPVVEAAVVVAETTMDGRPGKTFGIVEFEDGPHGLIIKPRLHGMDPGPHAAHVHEHPSCEPDDEMGMPAGAAGGHYDPEGTGVHAGPYGQGHLGDLPNLIVEPTGMASLTVVAPRVTVADLKGRSLMIHAGADRYDSYAEHEHGKGGMRMYCGVIR